MYPQELQVLQAVSNGLVWMSESDYPFDIVHWQNADATPFAGKQLPTSELDYFFRNVAEIKDWHNETQKALVPRYQELVQTLREHLRNPQVYRIGETQVDAYLVGTLSDGSIGGLHTILIET
ncbi:MAG: nuclease A inhibitor family protein [Candidatus Kapaibacteriota bacterium]|jgi:hypothetical protein